MAARGGDLDGAAAYTLTLHVRKVPITQEGACAPGRSPGGDVG